MAFQITEHGARVSCQFNTGLGTFTIVLWFSKPGYDAADLQALATQVKKTLVDELVDRLVIGGSLPSVIAYDARSQDGSFAIGNYVNGTGDLDSEQLPLKECLVLTLRTAKRGRAYRGRVFMSGYTEAQMTNGLFVSNEQTALQDAFEQLMSDVDAIGWTFGVRSGTYNGVLRDPAIITPITAVEVRNLVPGNQRRRTVRG